MLKMLIFNGNFPAKISPDISLDIYDNIIEKNNGGGGQRPPPPLFLGPALPAPQLCCREYPGKISGLMFAGKLLFKISF